jgi:glycosyltransferase involved in cell wall biosynthesis
MQDNRKVSVVIPVYRVEEYLPVCLESVCAQTHRNLQIILVDDGSPDGCGEICDRYAGQDSRIQVIHKENGGLSDARNAGIREACGDYLLFVDSDDRIAPDYVERLLALAKQYQADIVACDFEEFAEDRTLFGGRLSGTREEKKPDLIVLNREEAVLAWLYRRHYGVSAWGKLFAARVMEGVLFPKGKLHEDVGTTYKMFLQAETTVYTGEKLYGYRRRKGSIINQEFDRGRLAYLEFTREIMEQMRAEHPEFLQGAVSRHFQGCIQIACAQKKPEKALLKEIRRYAKRVAGDGQCRVGYRILAVCSLVSPRLAVRGAGMMLRLAR